MKIVVTGAAGLLGFHAAARLHARNCHARHRREAEPVELVRLDRAAFGDPEKLARALTGAGAVLHFAGVNRAPEEELEAANPAIAEALVAGCRAAGVTPHIVHANSIHAGSATAYGRSKTRAGEILAGLGGAYTDLVLPHIFGEGARPRYNNVTATLIEALIEGRVPELNPHGRVRLLHAGAAAEAAIEAALKGTTGRVAPEPRQIGVTGLWEKLNGFHARYSADVFPDLSDPFDLALFNSYRAAIPPEKWPRPIRLNADERGTLFEAAKSAGGGQTFVSWTEPGVTRGDHFHLSKVERFVVAEGSGVIRIRRVLSDEVREFRVTGLRPTAIDMPTLATHSIENTGDRPLLTLFWAQEIFDPANPDTYADPVRKAAK